MIPLSLDTRGARDEHGSQSAKKAIAFVVGVGEARAAVLELKELAGDRYSAFCLLALVHQTQVFSAASQQYLSNGGHSQAELIVADLMSASRLLADNGGLDRTLTH